MVLVMANMNMVSMDILVPREHQQPIPVEMHLYAGCSMSATVKIGMHNQ